MNFLRLIVALLHTLGSVAHADISSCTASVSPTSVQANATAALVFSVNNTSSNNAVWVKFTAPSEHFEILSGNSSGWGTLSEAPTEIIFRNGTLGAGSSANFTVNVQAGVEAQPAAAWTVLLSDSSSGNPAATCSGSTSVAIIGSDATAPQISNLTVSNITTSSVRITWTTNEAATSVVEYGTTTGYGSTESDSSLVTSHSVDLTGLTSNTSYHYRVQSADVSANTATSSDNTFTTAQVSATPTPTPTPTPAASSSSATPTPTTTPTTTPRRTVTITPAIPIPTPVETPLAVDTTPPAVRLTTDLTQPVSEVPVIGGEATDNQGVARVEYSTDGGENWLPALLDTEANRRGVAFTFQPSLTVDDNYAIRVRAFDFSGNSAVSDSYTLILDRLPPRALSALFTVGPQVLRPSADGIVYASQFIDTKITLSSIGGATEIDILAPVPEALPHVFSLVKNVESGLWSGILHFTQPGTYPLTVQARDGAGNVTSRELGRLLAAPGGQVSGANGPLDSATVELFYFEPTLQDFVPWNAAAFQQTNPQQTDAGGHYHFLVPAGRYYARVSAPGYATAATTIFSVEGSEPLVADVALSPRAAWRLGPWRLALPQLRAASVTPALLSPPPTAATATQTLVGESAPAIAPLGLPSLLTFMTEWSPDTAQQLAALHSLGPAAPGAIGIVMGDSNAARLNALRKRGGYRLPMVADATGEFFEQYRVSYVPTHVFVNPAGLITRIVSGVLNADELKHNLNE